MFTSKKDKLFTAIVENDLVSAEKLLKGSLNNNLSPNYEQLEFPPNRMISVPYRVRTVV